MSLYLLVSRQSKFFQMGREKDVSTRLIRPTIPEFDTSRLLMFVERWDPNWEHDASIKIFDEGIAQYMLADIESHYKYMAALILSKPSLRCRLVEEEPNDVLDAEGNVITLTKPANLSSDEIKKIEYMKQILHKRGYRFE
ncbi:hypothetical protein OESDEN_14831 [Oesophagostomum dentatum]|uniref:Uncharacterized protein n=2 Tax=Oesophagostomum dentatum TaxID=61180 RepID=A0A0B1SPJ3_OESDE|nr:hypothetical protein OESDEN_14831 [Oesophagostomum dentatum]